jgi:hypothetical protein
MPKFLEKKLESEYGKGDPRVYATMNAIGAMHGNKETAKGAAMQAKHDRDMHKPGHSAKVPRHSSDGDGHHTGH